MEASIVMEDEQGKIIYSNNKFVAFLKLPIKRSEIVGLDFADLILNSKVFSLDAAKLHKKYEELKNKKEPCTIDYLQTNEDQYYEVKYAPAFKGATLKGALWTFTNVTERKKAEIAQKEKQDFQENILNNSLDAVIILDEDGKIVKWDKKAEAIFGWTELEVINKLLTDNIMPKVHAHSHANGIAHYLKTGQQNIFGKTIQVPAVKKDSSEIIISLIVTASKNDKKTQFISFIRDITATKKLEEEINKQRIFIEKILNNIPADIAVFDLDHKYTFINKVAIKSDETREWMIGKDDFDYVKFKNIDDTKAKKRREVFDQILKSKVEFEYIDEYILADGDKKYVLRKFYPVITNGNVDFVIGYGTDITAIVESEHKSKTLIESSPDLIQSVDDKGEILFCNDIWCKTLGYAAEEVIGKNIFNFIAPSSIPHCHILFAEIMQSKTGMNNVAVDFSTKNGNTINALGNISLSFPGNKIVTNAFFKNITIEKLREQEIIDQKHFFENILDSVPTDLLVVNKKKVLVYVNKSSAIDHETRKLLVGKQIDEYIFTNNGLNSLSKQLLNIDKVINEKIEISWDEEHISQDQKELHTLRKLIPFSNNNEEFVILSGNDITDLVLAKKEIDRINKGLEVKINERTYQLENAIKELDSFSYSVSHDLRSPLRAIDGWSLALIEDYGDNMDETAKGYINRMRSESKRLGKLIDDLLSLSKIGKRQINRTQINFTEFCGQIFRRIIEAEEYKLPELNIQGEHVIYADETLLDILMTNLLSNAIKFSSKTESQKIEIGLRLVDAIPYYYIQDNGAGFEMNNASKLFGAFQRMHRQSDFSGTGIGLATVKRIVNLHGGIIFAESKINEGATFYFNLNYNKSN